MDNQSDLSKLMIMEGKNVPILVWSADLFGFMSAFLTIEEFCKVRECCRHIKSIANVDLYFKGFFWDQLFRKRESFQCVLSTNLANSTLISRNVLNSLKQRKILELLSSVERCSSIDRATESANNVLSVSRCFQFFKSNLENQLMMQHGEGTMGLFAQIQCGCANSRPCYWSSKPSVDPLVEEFIDFRIVTPIALVTGFSVTPYRAFFHPQSPVYGPVKVVLQFFAKIADSSGREKDEMYYQTEPFDVENAAEPSDEIVFPPVLVIDGRVRLLLQGMAQRQTLPEEGTAHSNDYYLCLSNVKLFGVPVNIEEVVEESPSIIINEVNLDLDSRLVENEAQRSHAFSLYQYYLKKGEFK